MNDSWPLLKLGAIAEIQQGKTLSVKSMTGGEHPVYGANGVIGFFSEGTYDFPVVALGCRGSCGTLHLAESGAFLANNVMAIWPRDSDQVSLGFLLHTLSACDLHSSGVISGQVQPQITRKALEPLEMRIPPLWVQRRIVDLMTHLDNLIVNLRRELDAAECLARAQREAAFRDLLVDSIAASDVFDMLLGRQKSAPQSVGAHVIPYIRAANISEHGLKLKDVQTMNFNPSEQERYCLQHDDVLLVEGGTVGLAARWSSEIPGPVGFDKHVIRLRAKPMSSCSEYALQWAKWSRETGAFAAEATGITIKALGFGRACKMLVPNLALESQFEVCAPLSALENQISLLRDELLELESLRTVILGSLLNGKLELEEDVEHLEHQAMT